MDATQYLIVGSSHAAIEAVNAIRLHDAEGSLTLATKDSQLPYSPTVLPYVVSGRSSPDRAFLRDDNFFARQKVDFRRGCALSALDPQRKLARFADGSEIAFDKILLATGAAPVRPPIPGLDTVPCHVLRTLDDATGLRAASGRARRAVVLGGGLVGMHAAENLVEAGQVEVTIVEMNSQVMGGYFDATAAALIEKAFAAHGARLLTGHKVVAAAPAGQGAVLALDNGENLEADLLLVAVGVQPDLGYLNGSGVACQAGILVDDTMQTSAAGVWAAGDCAQARNFFTGTNTLNAILPAAAEQGRIAGMAMAGDSDLKPYRGGVPLNTYRFFGHHALSVGNGDAPPGAEVMTRLDEAQGRYLKAIFHEDCLRGIFAIDEFFDGGVMWELIRRRIDLSAMRERFFADPLAAGRELMSQHWR
ncbi:MAG: FAD-dependent oxidoreductase [Desulfobulbus sp.]|nr:FAD-dependent oxidoreductase [Desulfobulbus sp.]